MEQLIGVLIIALAGGGTTAALLATIVILAPNLSSKTSRTIETMPGRSFILGAVNFIFFFGVAYVLGQIGNGIGGFFGGLFSLAALVISLILLLLLSIGLSGLVRLISERGTESNPVAAGRLFKSAVLLVSAGLAPLAGWFVLTPLALFVGLGATILALFQSVGSSFSSRSSNQTID